MLSIVSQSSSAQILSFLLFNIIIACGPYQHNAGICSSKARSCPVLWPYLLQSGNTMPKTSHTEMTLSGIGKYATPKPMSQYCMRTSHKLMSVTSKQTMRFIQHSPLLLICASFAYNTVSYQHEQDCSNRLFLQHGFHTF